MMHVDSANRPQRCLVPRASALASQVEVVATGRHHCIVLEKRGGVPGPQLVETRHQKDMSNLIARPANFFDALAPPPPAATLTNKPINVAPGLVGLGAVSATHHHHGAGFFKAHRSRPVFPEADRGIDCPLY